jgi:hypothetical protein
LGEDRFGNTKTDESDSYMPVPPDIGREIAERIAFYPQRDNPRAFLFINRRGTAFSVGNYLKKQLKPLPQSVGILDLTHAYPKARHGQRYAASPEAFGPRGDATALRQGHSREPAYRVRSPGYFFKEQPRHLAIDATLPVLGERCRIPDFIAGRHDGYSTINSSARNNFSGAIEGRPYVQRGEMVGSSFSA